MQQYQYLDLAYQKSIKLLKKNSTQYGYQAAPINPVKPSYSNIFGRDASICALATLDHPDQQLVETAKLSLQTLRQAQSDLGQIPFRTNPQTNYKDYWYPGNLDSTLWWVLAALRQIELFPQMKADWQADIERALLWLRYQDTAETGLIIQGEGGDWADEMPTRGATLYSNALWYQALQYYQQVLPESSQAASKLFDQSYIAHLRQSFSLTFWPYDEQKDQIEALENRAFRRPIQWMQVELTHQPYFIQYLSHRQYGWRCDLFANTLCLLTDLPNPQQRTATSDHLAALQQADPFPGRTLHPVIYPGTQEWHPSMASRHQDVPYQYHNGGIWPYIGGFWVGYLATTGQIAQAQTGLYQLAQAAEVNDWQFNEYFHGQLYSPLGIHHQSWNAAMYIAAYRSTMERQPLFSFYGQPSS